MQETGATRVPGRSPELEAPQEPGLALVNTDSEDEDLDDDDLDADLDGEPLAIALETLTPPPTEPEPAPVAKPAVKRMAPVTKVASAVPAAPAPIATPEVVAEETAIAPPEAAEAEPEVDSEVPPEAIPDYPQAVYEYLIQQREARLTDIEKALKLSRVQVVDAIRTLLATDQILKHRDGPETREGEKRYRVNVAPEDAET